MLNNRDVLDWAKDRGMQPGGKTLREYLLEAFDAIEAAPNREAPRRLKNHVRDARAKMRVKRE